MRRSGWLWLCAWLVAPWPIPALAQGPSNARVMVTPRAVRLGEPAVYRATLVVDPGVRAQWLPPDTSSALTWGPRRAWRAVTKASAGHAGVADTIGIEIPVQAFELGPIALPGIEIMVGTGDRAATYRMPTATLTVLPMISPADSQATLKPIHGPLAAPWWERVPWAWVAGALLLIAALVLLIRRLRRRPPAEAKPVPGVSPAEAALTALAELRQERLPEGGRMAEHAYRLGQILRRYLEATTGTTMPGHSTPEMVGSLAASGMTSEDQQRLIALLRGWDRVKFARAPLTVEEAVRSEQAVETFVRRPLAAPAEPQAGAA
jgi:uncharacterized protein DUF4381